MELFIHLLNGGIFITKEYNMKKVVRLTESDLTRIVKGVIKEENKNSNSFNFDKPIMTFRDVVNSILTDISVKASMKYDEFDEYDPLYKNSQVPDYLRPYVKEIENYVKNEMFMEKIYDSIYDVIMDTPIQIKIEEDILSK